MTEDQLKQELAEWQAIMWRCAEAYGAKCPLGENTFDAHFAGIEKVITRFSDQRVKAEYKSLIEMVIPTGDMKYHRYAVPVQTLAKRLQELQGSEAVTPPNPEPLSNASTAKHLPDCEDGWAYYPEDREHRQCPHPIHGAIKQLKKTVDEASTNGNAPQKDGEGNGEGK